MSQTTSKPTVASDMRIEDPRQPPELSEQEARIYDEVQAEFDEGELDDEFGEYILRKAPLTEVFWQIEARTGRLTFREQDGFVTVRRRNGGSEFPLFKTGRECPPTAPLTVRDVGHFYRQTGQEPEKGLNGDSFIEVQAELRLQEVRR